MRLDDANRIATAAGSEVFLVSQSQIVVHRQLSTAASNPLAYVRGKRHPGPR